MNTLEKNYRMWEQGRGEGWKKDKKRKETIAVKKRKEGAKWKGEKEGMRE